MDTKTKSNTLDEIFNNLKQDFKREYFSLKSLKYEQQLTIINSIFKTNYNRQDLINYLSRKEKVTKVCLICKTSFKTAIGHKKYCSERCRENAYKKRKAKKEWEKRIPKNCKKCGIEFKPKYYNSIYCPLCKEQEYNKIKNNWKLENPEKYREHKKIYSSKKETKVKKQKDYHELNDKSKELSLKKGVYKTEYTQKEDDFLIKNWNKMTKKDIAKELNRTYASVNSRYKKLNSSVSILC